VHCSLTNETRLGAMSREGKSTSVKRLRGQYARLRPRRILVDSAVDGDVLYYRVLKETAQKIKVIRIHEAYVRVDLSGKAPPPHDHLEPVHYLRLPGWTDADHKPCWFSKVAVPTSSASSTGAARDSVSCPAAGAAPPGFAAGPMAASVSASAAVSGHVAAAPASAKTVAGAAARVQIRYGGRDVDEFDDVVLERILACVRNPDNRWKIQCGTPGTRSMIAMFQPGGRIW
jgi:hypothetical protein